MELKKKDAENISCEERFFVIESVAYPGMFIHEIYDDQFSDGFLQSEYVWAPGIVFAQKYVQKSDAREMALEILKESEGSKDFIIREFVMYH